MNRKEMTKDPYIADRFRAYFAGAAAPKCDLTEAKRALSEATARVRREKRRHLRAISCAAVAACLIVIAAVVFSLLPALSAIRYTIAEATPSPATYTELREEYGEKMAPFAPFSVSENASAEYILYEYRDEEVLLVAKLRFLSGTTKFEATVRIDLTDGKYVEESFGDYRKLSEEGRIAGRKYRFERGELINGEYVSRGYYESEGWRVCLDVSSQNERAISFLLKILLGS